MVRAFQKNLRDFFFLASEWSVDHSVCAVPRVELPLRMVSADAVRDGVVDDGEENAVSE